MAADEEELVIITQLVVYKVNLEYGDRGNEAQALLSAGQCSYAAVWWLCVCSQGS